MFRPAIAVISILLLLVAFVFPEVLQIVLVSAGMLGLMGLRLAATGGRWAPRGAAWAARAT
jgi:hypothetical protein